VLVPAEVALPAAPSLVVAGRAHTCALIDSEPWCWGDNRHGQLGVAAVETQTSEPVRVGLAGARDLRAGGDRTCAVLESGELYCWGSNDLGQVGDGSGDDRRAPERISLSP